jgi:hypothetical protein
MKSLFVFAVVVLVGCGGSASKPKEVEPPVDHDSGMSQVDSGSTMVDAASVDVGSTVVDSGTDVGVVVMVDAGHDSGHEVTVDAGHDAAKVVADTGVDAGPCTLPSTAATFTYTFTNVTTTCDNTLASYSVGPLNAGAYALSTLVPSFCAKAGDVATVSDSVVAADDCEVSETVTCSDPVPATLPDGGTDPLTDVSVVKLTSNLTGTDLTGTLSLTTTDEVTKATCTQTYTFKATTL